MNVYDAQATEGRATTTNDEFWADENDPAGSNEQYDAMLNRISFKPLVS